VKGITKEHHSIPAFIGRNWVGLLKNTLRPNVRKKITKEQHITQSCFIGRNWVGLLKNTLKTKHKKRNHKGAAHHSIPAFIGEKLGRTVEKYS
jgi:hypothetical protein